MNRSEIQKARLEEQEFQKAYEELFGETFEKAHKDGDTHPNGKWVWVSSVNGGKGDWRTINGRAHKKMLAAGGGGGNGGATGSGKTGGGEKKVADKPVKTDKPAAKTKAADKPAKVDKPTEKTEKTTESKNNDEIQLTVKDYDFSEKSVLEAAASNPPSIIKIGARVWRKISRNLWSTGYGSNRMSESNEGMFYEIVRARKRGKEVDTSKVIVNNDSVWQNKEFTGIVKLGKPDMKQVNDEDYDDPKFLKYSSVLINEKLNEKSKSSDKLRQLIETDADREALQQASNEIATVGAKIDKMIFSIAKLKQAEFVKNNDADTVIQSGDVDAIIDLGKPDWKEINRLMQNNPDMLVGGTRREIRHQIISYEHELESYLKSGKRENSYIQDTVNKIANLETFCEIARYRSL